MDKLNNVITKFKTMDRVNLESFKYFTFFIIVANMIGLYWYLQWKKFSIALLFVSMIFLTILLLLERKLPEEIKQKKISKKDESDNEEEEEGLGLPSAEDYNERLEGALETGF